MRGRWGWLVAVIAASGLALMLIATASSDDAAAPEAPPVVVGGDLPQPLLDHLRSAYDAQQARIERERENRQTSSGQLELADSASAFADLSTPEALSVLQDQHDEALPDPASVSLDDAVGSRVDHYVSDHTAVIDNDAGPNDTVVVSTLPLRVDQSGNRVPVDLGLRDEGLEYLPAAPLTPIRIAKDVSGGVSFLGSGLGIGLDSDSSPAPVVHDNAVFWANVASDSDYTVSPRADGFESFLQLRSDQSPEEFRFSLQLPEGATVVASDAVPGGADIMRDGAVIASVSAPAAWDADHLPVRSDVRVEGTELVVAVHHRGTDVRYPLLVDPVAANPDSYLFGPSQGLTGWTYTTPDPVRYSQFFGQAYLGWGAYQRTLNGPQGQTPWIFNQNESSYWVYKAPPGAAITKFVVKSSEHEDGAPYGGNTCGYDGVYNGAGTAWEASTTKCFTFAPENHTFDVASLSNGATLGNKAMVGIWMPTTAARGYFMRYFGGADIYLRDDTLPTTQLSTLPTGWQKDNSKSWQLTAADNGLGIKSATLTGAASYSDTSCDASYVHRCAASKVLTGTVGGLGEGVTRIRATAQDFVNNSAAALPDTTAYDIKVDRVAPGLALTGSLADLDGQWVSGNSYTLTASATEAVAGVVTSGVKTIEVKIDGTDPNPAAYLYNACASDSCNASKSFTVDISALAAGTHTISVAATDVAGNTTTKTVTLKLERNAPSIDATGSLRTTPSLTATSYGLHVIAADGSNQSGVVDLTGTIDGQTISDLSQTCSSPCTPTKDYTFRTRQFSLGDHEIVLTARDAANNQTVVRWTLHVEDAATVGLAPSQLSLMPKLETSVAPNQDAGTPGDLITWSADAVNAGATASVRADVTATSTDSEREDVGSYFVQLERRDTSGSWNVLAAVDRRVPGYAPETSASEALALDLEATPQASTGVSYAAGHDKLLATHLEPGAAARWTVEATAQLTAAQVEQMLDAQQTTAVRETVHVEFTDTDGTHVAARTTTTDLTGQIRSQSAALRHVEVTATSPAGTERVFNESTDPGLALIAPGANARMTFSEPVPSVAPRGASESADAYLRRLSETDDAPAPTTLSSAADADGPTQAGSSVPGPDQSIAGEDGAGAITYAIPVLSVADVGPTGAGAGASLAYTVSVPNTGHAAASDVAASETVDGGAATAINGIASALDPAATSTTHLTHELAANRPPGAFTHSVSVSWQDTNGNTYGPVSDEMVTNVVDSNAPAAPPLSPTGVTPMGPGTDFLHDGDNPVQTGVLDGTIDTLRAAVVQGAVTDASGAPLAGARVVIAEHPEYGQTTTRPDGRYWMSVNGGGSLTISVSKSGFLPVIRNVDVPWQDYAQVDDIALTPLDTAVTNIDLSDPVTPIQVARGSLQSDERGSRQATLMFSAGTTATMKLEDGSTVPLTQPLAVRATEYTVGDNGPNAMPAPVAPYTGYTYAVEYSVDQALAAGAKSVNFSKPVVSYVDNFLGFHTGADVPVGYVDPDTHAWTPQHNGRVISILSITGGMADVAVDTSGQQATAAALAALGITDAERRELASLYSPGKSLWRVSITHFSPWDFNWVVQLPSDAIAPVLKKVKDLHDKLCGQSGSYIGCEAQSLGEDADVTGTHLGLHYRSDRFRGYDSNYTRTFRITPDVVPSKLAEVRAWVYLAGRRYLHTFNAPFQPNQKLTVHWDGTDVFGRAVVGSVPFSVNLEYKYPAGYAGTAGQDLSFGSPQTQWVTPAREGQWVWLGQQFSDTIGALPPNSDGLGGWSLDAVSAYDPVSRTLYSGDGERREADSLPLQVNEVAGAGYIYGCGGPADVEVPATSSYIRAPDGLAVTADGSIYIAAHCNEQVLRVDPNGIIHLVAGSGSHGFSGDGGPATQATFNTVSDVAVAPNGEIYISDLGNHRIRKIDKNGIITTVAGSTAGFSGDGGPASAAQLNRPDGLSFGPDGSLYIADTANYRVRRITPDGTISTVAGDGGQAGGTGDGGQATAADIGPATDVYVAPDGALYIGTYGVRKVTAEGLISTVVAPSAGGLVKGVAGDRAGNVVWVSNSADMFELRPDGGSTRLAAPPNTGIRDSPRNGSIARDARYTSPEALAVTPDGAILLAEANYNHVYRIAAPLPGLTRGNFVVPSEDGSQLYQFDVSGRQIKTVNTLTGSDALTFDRDAAGRLSAITDSDGNSMRVRRSPDGRATALIAPFGQTTRLDVNDAGQLERITDPGGNQTAATYDDGGLLRSFTPAGTGTSSMDYSTDGRLVSDHDPGQGSKNLTRTETDTGSKVAVSTALGRTTTYEVSNDNQGGLHRSITDPSGLSQSATINDDGSATATTADGSQVTTKQSEESGDNRFGLMAPVLTQVDETSGSHHRTVTTSRTATLADQDNPLSLTSLTGTVAINGKTANSSYNPTTRQETVTSPAGRVFTTGIDAVGRPTAVSAPGVASTSLGYTTQGLLDHVSQGSRTWRYHYDDRGRTSSVDDPVSNSTAFSYDDADRVIERTEADGSHVAFAYDPQGNLASISPPTRPAYSSVFDALGRLSESRAPDVGDGATPVTFAYNDDKQLTGVHRADGRDVALSYDDGGRLESVSSGTDSIRTTFDPQSGHVASTDGPGGVHIAYGYDGSLFNSTTYSGPVSATVTRTFDDDFRLAASKVADSQSVSYGYDADGLMTAAGAETLGRSNTTGLLESTSLGSLTTGLSYNQYGETETQTASYSGTEIYRSTTSRDGLGRRLTETQTVNGQAASRSYLYDQIGRLTDVLVPGQKPRHYDYDENGNRASVTDGMSTITASYDAQDRLTRYGTRTFTYTKTGDRKTSTDASGTTRYGYDDLGRLRSVDLPNGHQITYITDPEGNRIAKQVDGSTVAAFAYGPEAYGPLAQLDAQGHVLARFVYGASTSTPDYMVQGGTTYRFVTDDRGSVRMVVNTSTGEVAQQLSYDEFGVITQDTNSGFQPFGFAGGLVDSDTGLVHFGARDYDPSVGGWTTKDPLGLGADGWNQYAYAGNDPINRIDPSGLISGQDVANAGAGFGDAITGGLTGCLRNAVGLDDRVDTSSWAYTAGMLTGTAVASVLEPETVAASTERTVVIGRDMPGRVIPYARQNGYDWYKGTPNWVPRKTLERLSTSARERTDMWFNKRWINKEMRKGSRVVDIGEPVGYPPSDFYAMERERVAGYDNYYADPQP